MGNAWIPALVGVITAVATSVAAAVSLRRRVEPSNEEIAEAEAAAALAISAAIDGGDASGNTYPEAGSRGRERAREILAAYTAELLDEADRIARRAGAERASDIHMDLAADHIGILRRTSSALADIGLAVGGIAFGVSTSYYVNIVTGGTAEVWSVPWAIAVGAAGLGIFVISATVKWLGR